MDFGSRIRQLRKNKNYSLRDFAEQVKIDFTYLSKIENSKVDPPSEEKIRLMAHFLEVEPEELLGLAGKVSSEQLRKAVETNPNVGILLRKLQSRELSDNQIKYMLNIAMNKSEEHGTSNNVD
jgi:transcriptional regulator with XRE-family HTH domain